MYIFIFILIFIYIIKTDRLKEYERQQTLVFLITFGTVLIGKTRVKFIKAMDNSMFI